MLYEVREYVATPGRLEALITRFKEHTFRLFDKHQMDLVQIGVTSVGDHSFNEVVYTLRFADAADMERKWGEFIRDPEWIAVFRASEAEGPLVQSMRRRLVDASAFGDLDKK
ncbi:NIPSNAP family protein (plasmid) [Pseudonocardia bannensis]|uniref:NIPSNAP family protein n=1 Tax=Pseudonocardia bannensis TaxID=630973 RepID=A0A848DI45_9PSEU|nr:NIPSNAP family protein [Pseudonocardia bannensis]NMH92358.1 NIPSNAP family protein [Pseudonocardia bannensis]